MRNFIVVTGLMLGMCVTTQTAYAARDTCKKVTIRLTNELNTRIKVLFINYYDYDKEKWRKETIYPKQKIDAGKSTTYLRNLEGVKNDKTKFEITYQRPVKGKFKSAENYHWYKSGVSVCEDAKIYQFNIR